MQSDSDHRISYLLKYFTSLAIIFVDIGLNSTVDQSDSIGSVIAFTVVQIVLRLCSIFTLFMFMWQTFVFRYGLIGVLCKKFKLLFLVLPTSLAFTLAIRIIRITKIGGSSPVEMWDQDYYLPLFFIHNLTSLAFYFAILKAAFDLADPAYYKAEKWIN